jgi:eukaryotic-like serine/threonine-protein kinase
VIGKLGGRSQYAAPAGERLGPYEIVAPIGAEAWARFIKARTFAWGARSPTLYVERGNPFEREARSIAALNHPKICQLYDVGPKYLVMEFVEGTPLNGPVPT